MHADEVGCGHRAGSRGVQWAKIRQQKDVLITAAVLGTCCVLTAGTAIAGLGDTAHFCLVLACLAAVLGTCWWKLDYGLGVVCIYMAAAQAVAIDTSGPADFFFLRCPQPCRCLLTDDPPGCVPDPPLI